VGLMKGTLDTGTRRLVGRAETAAFWACYQRDQSRRQANHAEPSVLTAVP